MIFINYKLSSYTDFLQQIAASFHTTISGNTLQVPEVYGSGFFKVVQVNEDIEALVYNVNVKKDLVFKRGRDGDCESDGNTSVDADLDPTEFSTNKTATLRWRYYFRSES